MVAVEIEQDEIWFYGFRDGNRFRP